MHGRPWCSSACGRGASLHMLVRCHCRRPPDQSLCVSIPWSAIVLAGAVAATRARRSGSAVEGVLVGFVRLVFVRRLASCVLVRHQSVRPSDCVVFLCEPWLSFDHAGATDAAHVRRYRWAAYVFLVGLIVGLVRLVFACRLASSVSRGRRPSLVSFWSILLPFWPCQWCCRFCARRRRCIRALCGRSGVVPSVIRLCCGVVSAEL